ncbi:MAG: TerB family tellurite resistance protein [Flavobacteriales bacterium]|jgi:hypothetical protein|nr:MAG: TerB family tellurite resistance protein [Flavobacteriales bacterium]
MRTHYETVYAALGRLFHAVAACDGRVAPEEQRSLNELIKKRWLPFEGSIDRYGTDAAHYIGFAFDSAAASHAPVEEDFSAFKDTLREHASLFTDELRTLIWETAHEVAKAYGGESDAEQELLARLGQLLHGKQMPA